MESMKALLLSFGALLLLSVNLPAQSLHVQYKKFVVPGNTEYGRWASSPEMKRKLRDREEKMASNVSEYYDLVATPRQAYFSFDTLVQLAAVDEGSPWWGRMNQAKISHAQDLRTGDVSARSDLLPDSICSGSNFREKYQWKPSEGLRIFAELECRRLVHFNTETKDSVVAWYAPAIPLPTGPEDYAGAPGLILAVEAPSYNYIAEKIETGDFKVEKTALPSGQCLEEKAFRAKLREAAMNKFMKE